MRAFLASISIAAAACGGPTSARPGGASGGFDMGLVCAPAPGKGNTAPLDALAVPFEKAKALVDTIPEDERPSGSSAEGMDGDEDPKNDPRPAAYDLDRDGTVDLVAFPEVMFGPSLGWIVFSAEGGKLKRLFAISGSWHEARTPGGTIALSFHANILAPGEPRFLTTLRLTKGAWEPPIKSYLAQQTKVPATRPPYAGFTTRGAATLRATPAVDDKPNPEDPGDDFDKSTTLKGNVVATYAAAARGTVLASEGEWRYVAFDPATKPTGTSLSHGMDAAPEASDETTEQPENRLLSDAWLCGWIAAAEIDVKK